MWHTSFEYSKRITSLLTITTTILKMLETKANYSNTNSIFAGLGIPELVVSTVVQHMNLQRVPLQTWYKYSYHPQEISEMEHPVKPYPKGERSLSCNHTTPLQNECSPSKWLVNWKLRSRFHHTLCKRNFEIESVEQEISDPWRFGVDAWLGYKRCWRSSSTTVMHCHYLLGNSLQKH